jgi:hypothetical protein
MKTLLNILIVSALLVLGVIFRSEKSRTEKAETISRSSIEKKIILTPTSLLLNEGRRLDILSLRGKQHETLQRAAESHAKYQAKIGIQGHQRWDERYAILQSQLPGFRFSEVCNESWPGQSEEDAAKEMFRSWKLSSGHWATVNGECTYYGYAMVLGRNGIWYACGVVAK